MSKLLRAARFGALVSAVVMLLAAATMPVAAAGQLPGHFLGDAWGNKGNAKSGDISTRLGRAAYQPCPCGGTNGQIRSNSVDNVDGGGKSYKAGHVVDTAQAEKRSEMRAFGQTTSRVSNVRALDGLITADSMAAVATVRANSSSITPNHDGSAITGLKINGHSETVNPGQRIDLPGFGYVVFYDVHNFGDGTTVAGTQVEMMRIVITRANSLDIPIGSVITSTHARVGYSRTVTGSVVDAAAWGSSANSTSSDVRNAFGRSAAAYLGCFAKGSSSGSNRVNSTDDAGTFTTGQIVSKVHGEVSSDLALAQASSRLESVNLLDGTLTADVVQGAVSASVDASGGHTSFAGSKFVNLSILGQPFGDDVAPNTVVDLPGLGTMTLYATTASADGTQAHASVDMVILHVTSPNSQGIPAGSDIKLAHASAEAHP